jgi:putative drug exporter of the RND superfamily
MPSPSEHPTPRDPRRLHASPPPHGAPPAPGRRSLTTLCAWGIAIVVLALLGAGIEGRLAPMSLEVPGTPSARAEAMLKAKFGNTVPIAILLRGPPAQLEGEGQALAGRLGRIKRSEVLSPWERSPLAPDAPTRTLSALRPHPDAAFVLVDYVRPASRTLEVVPQTEAVLRQTIHAPVHSYLTGIAVIGRAIQTETLRDTERAELVALPVLVLVLLLVFRSPVAALVPLLTGGATVAAGRGLLWLASFLTPINSLGVAIAAMMSLALGVDYALLMVSRVRQELAHGHDHQAAVTIASRSAGRTILAAGGTLALTMLAASLVATPGLLGPVAIGVVISGLLSVALALSAMPALLRLLGPSLDRWEIGFGRRSATAGRGRAGLLAERLIAHPAVSAPLILAGMLLLAAPAVALRMGPPDAAELPASSPARNAVRMIERTVGAGWSAPFVIVATSRSGAITTPQRLRAIVRWQEGVQRQPDVAAVLGPGSIAGATHTLTEAHAALASAPERIEGADRGVKRLRSGLLRASEGVQRLRGGLASAAAGASALSAGAGQAQVGGLRLAGAAERASAGASELAVQSGRAQEGASQVAAQTGRAQHGAQQLAAGTARARRGAGRLAGESGRATRGVGALQAGLANAASGSAQLASGLDEAAAGADRLAASDRPLTAGAEQLAAGLHALDGAAHAVLQPVELLAKQLEAWAGWLESLHATDARLSGRLREATRELAAIAGSREDPHHLALSQDLAAIEATIERSELSQLSRIEEQLSQGLEELAQLPAALSKLTGALDRLTAGGERLAAGARESQEGAESLSSGLHRLAASGHTLNAGLGRLSGGAGRLAGGLGRLQGGDRRLAGGLGSLAHGDKRLAGGLRRLQAGDRRLADGLRRLYGGDRRLAGGLHRLARGGDQLAGGLGKLQGGDRRLEGGLSGATGHVAALASGLHRTQRPLKTYEDMLDGYERDYRLLNADSPHATDSGYLVLTALDGTVSPLREQVAQMVDVDAGGQTARLVVVAHSAPSSAATAALSARLRRQLPALASATGGSVEIGQGAQYLLDYKNANTARFPWLVLALAIVATLTLIAVLRALLLPLIAVLLNLATIFAALGALQLLTESRLLGGAGGPPYIDAASGAGIISIMFVLSIDYEVFLLTRMRERWLERRDADSPSQPPLASGRRDAEEAITHGLRHTAGVITGSAAIMTAVFLAFALAAVMPLRQFGVGLTIAVLLDATLVRLVLLPSIMRLAGPRVWWLPAWLERRLPAFE